MERNLEDSVGVISFVTAVVAPRSTPSRSPVVGPRTSLAGPHLRGERRYLKMWKKALRVMALVIAISFAGLRAADHPLSVDDVRLLLIGGASADKMISL